MIVLALIISTAALAISLFVALALMEVIAHTELASSVEELEASELDLNAGAIGSSPSSHGMPAHLDDIASGVVLFLSPVCKTCSAIARSFDGSIPEDVTVVATAADSVRLEKWVAEHNLPTEHIVVDDDYTIVDSLGITGTPAVLGLSYGAIAFALAVPNGASLKKVLAQHHDYATGFGSANELLDLTSKEVEENAGAHDN